MAPSSHVWKGICAAFVIPAKLKQVSGKTTRAGATVPKTMKSVKSMHWKLIGRIVERAQEGNTTDKIHNNLTE